MITSTEDHTTDLTSHMSSTSTEGGTAGSTEPQVAGTKYNVALVVTLTLLVSGLTNTNKAVYMSYSLLCFKSC